MFTYTTPTFITEALCLVIQVQLLLTTVTVKLTPYTALANSYWVVPMMHINAKPTTI